MKRLLRHLAYACGLLTVWRYVHRKQITILMLHGTADADASTSWRPIWERLPTSRLDQLLAGLGRHYTFLSLDEAVEIIAGRRSPVDYGLVLTFDDGYRNNITEAFPILKAHGAPATLFVTTGYVESGRSFWIDRLDFALQQAPDAARNLRFGNEHFDLRGGGARLASEYRRLRLAVKEKSADDEEMLRTFSEMAGKLETAGGRSIDEVIDDDPFVSVAGWAELSSAAKDGFTIGSHTRDHSRLASIPRNDVDEQLTASRQEIRERLGEECRYFAYPNGSFDDFVLDRVRAAGYSAALCTRVGLNRVGENLFALKRYPVPTRGSIIDVLFAISGLLESPVARSLQNATLRLRRTSGRMVRFLDRLSGRGDSAKAVEGIANLRAPGGFPQDRPNE